MRAFRRNPAPVFAAWAVESPSVAPTDDATSPISSEASPSRDVRTHKSPRLRLTRIVTRLGFAPDCPAYRALRAVKLDERFPPDSWVSHQLVGRRTIFRRSSLAVPWHPAASLRGLLLLG